MPLAGLEGVPIPVPTIIKVKLFTAANFYNLQYVYVITNTRNPVTQLLDKLKKPWMTSSDNYEQPDQIYRPVSSYLSCSRSMYWIKVHLHQMVTPYIYFLFILWLPKNEQNCGCCWHSCSVSRSTVSASPRLSCCGLCVVAGVCPFLVNLLILQEG